jgi:transcriptional regulator with XRE-family HTH domain
VSAERGALVSPVGDLAGSTGGPAGSAADGQACAAPGDSRQEVAAARLIRARELVAGASPDRIAVAIAAECGSSRIRAYRLALGIALADVVAQVRARFLADGRRVPRFSETLLSAYESGQKRPGPEYLHYLCAAYQADPGDLGLDGRCLCGGSHRLRTPEPGPQGAPVQTVPAQAAPLQAGLGEQAAVHGGQTQPEPAQPAAVHGGQTQPGPVHGAPVQPALVQSAPVDQGPVLASVRDAAAVPAPRPWPAAALPSATAAALPPALAVAGPVSDPAGPVSHPAGPGGGRTASESAGDADDDELRRMLIRQMTTAGCQVDSRFLGAIDRIRRRTDDALLGATVSAAMIDTWEQSTAAYGRQYMTVPAVRLLCDVLLDLGDVRRRCEERQPLEFAERLCRLASQLAGLAGISMLDIGDHRLARSFFRTARTAADETGDRQLRAWVVAREALVPLYYGDPREAAALAGTAADLAGRHLCVAAVMAPVVECRAQARIAAVGGSGRREALDRARAALDKAADAIADLADDQRADTALGYTERQLYFHTGDTLVGLGDWQAAHRAFGLAAQLYPAAELLDRALVTLGRARCLLEADEPAQALALARHTVLGLPPEHRTDVVQRAARHLGQVAGERHPSLPQLAEYHEALTTA